VLLVLLSRAHGVFGDLFKSNSSNTRTTGNTTVDYVVVGRGAAGNRSRTTNIGHEYFPASVYEADAEILNIINDDDFS
jgi:hypothetical protein